MGGGCPLLSASEGSAQRACEPKGKECLSACVNWERERASECVSVHVACVCEHTHLGMQNVSEQAGIYVCMYGVYVHTCE